MVHQVHRIVSIICLKRIKQNYQPTRWRVNDRIDVDLHSKFNKVANFDVLQMRIS